MNPKQVSALGGGVRYSPDSGRLSADLIIRNKWRAWSGGEEAESVSDATYGMPIVVIGNRQLVEMCLLSFERSVAVF